MKRYTIWQEETQQYVSTAVEEKAVGLYSGAAIERLAKVENLYEQLQQEQQQVLEKLEQLRQQGKNKTTTFQQMLARKLQLADLLRYFDIYADMND